MPRQLDDSAGGAAARAIEALGVTVHPGKSTARAARRRRRVSGAAVRRRQPARRRHGDRLGRHPPARRARARSAASRSASAAASWSTTRCAPAIRTSSRIGECALHRGMIYGLVAPGYEMADVVARQLDRRARARRSAARDLSTKLKLMGVDVASFGDPFARRSSATEHVVFHDVVRGVYKKLVFSADGKRLLGGILSATPREYGTLVSTLRSAQELPDAPDELILGRRGGAARGAARDADAQVCSCNNVTQGQICARDPRRRRCAPSARSRRAPRPAPAAAAACRWSPTSSRPSSRRAARRSASTLCEHFAFTRQELFEIVARQAAPHVRRAARSARPRQRLRGLQAGGRVDPRRACATSTILDSARDAAGHQRPLPRQHPARRHCTRSCRACRAARSRPRS